jgi:2-C-methyl-D-erythritol 4-phosphate cytidylyltransferase
VKIVLFGYGKLKKEKEGADVLIREVVFMIDVIYLNGGTGKRAELGYPKQFARLKGKPIMIYGLENLMHVENISKIIIPCKEGKEEFITRKNLHLYGIRSIKNCITCNAGNTRQESVYNGLEHVETKQVLIMESVRPFTSINLIKKVIDIDGDCVSPMDQSIASVIDVNGVSYERNDIGTVQMPQKFDTKKLQQVHKDMKEETEKSTDDMDLIFKYDVIYNEFPFNRLVVFHGERENIKITYPIDLKIAEAILDFLEGEKDE